MSPTPDPWTTREAYRAALRAIRDQIITKLKTDQMDEPQARHAGIQQRNLCLEGPDAPLFFQPYQDELEPLHDLDYAIYDPSLEDYQNIRDLHITMQNCLSQASPMNYPKTTGIAYKPYASS